MGQLSRLAGPFFTGPSNSNCDASSKTFCVTSFYSPSPSYFFRIVKQMTLIPDDPGRVLCPSQFQPSHGLLPHCRSYMITSVHYASANCPAVFFLFLTSQITAAHILPILQLLKPDFADSSVPAFSLSAGFGSRSNPRGEILFSISTTRAAQ